MQKKNVKKEMEENQMVISDNRLSNFLIWTENAKKPTHAHKHGQHDNHLCAIVYARWLLNE